MHFKSRKGEKSHTYSLWHNNNKYLVCSNFRFVKKLINYNNLLSEKIYQASRKNLKQDHNKESHQYLVSLCFYRGFNSLNSSISEFLNIKLMFRFLLFLTFVNLLSILCILVRNNPCCKYYLKLSCGWFLKTCFLCLVLKPCLKLIFTCIMMG